MRDRLRRLPLRVRLVAGFSVAMLVVLVAAGGFVYWRVQYALDRGLDTELAQATGTLQRLVQADGTVDRHAAADATGVAWQVIDEDGTVVDHGGPATSQSMVTARQLARVGGGVTTIDVGDFLPVSRAPYRLHVTRASRAPHHYLLVGVRRDHRDEALRELLLQLALAGLGALVITAFVGDRLAVAALRPVERYRRRAAEIAAGAADLRLDVPEDRDDEVTRLGHTFNTMLASLERSLERERHFVDEASHELRTPITLLTGRLQLAGRRHRSVEEHERILEELRVDLDRLARLAEQLLQLGAPARAGSSDLAVVARRVVEQRRPGEPVEPVEADVPDAAPVEITEVEAERLLTNLLENARLHGAPPYRLLVDRPTSEHVRVQVVDAGPGMDRDMLHRATERFARAEDARSRPGSGLGLALVASLVAQAHGELRLCFDGEHVSHGEAVPVECDHGREMTVTILLPADTTA